MTIQEMKDIKKEKGYSYTQIAELSGVPLGTVQKIFNGQTESPRYDTLLALEKLFSAGKAGTGSDMVCESAVKYGTEGMHTQGSYTIDDYMALPDDQRVELIDGYFYDMSAPTVLHQRIAGEVYRQIANYIMDHDGACNVLMSPVDVQLDCDEKTMVQPDVLIVCDENQVVYPWIYGAPDFVLEVLSPSTSKKDCTKKLQKYQDAGVREYWILDPRQEIVMVYVFSSDVCLKFYLLGEVESIPLSVYDGKLSIEVKHIRRWIREAKNVMKKDEVE